MSTPIEIKLKIISKQGAQMALKVIYGTIKFKSANKFR